MFAALLALAQQAACPSILPGFAKPSLSDTCLALLAEESGPTGALIVGGQFSAPGHRIVRWDGASWLDMSGGLPGTVDAFARFDHGTGLHTIAAGEFGSGPTGYPRFVAEWTGSAWLGVPLGPDGTVSALATFDDGSGAALYAGGNFTTTGGASIARLARWNGSAWSAVGGTFDAPVRALVVHDDGTGPALYAAGQFTSVGAASIGHIARWNGSSWSALGSGVNGDVLALASFEGTLVAGGAFTSAGGSAASHIARWSGGTWQPLGSGTDAAVYALAVHDDRAGARLFAGGDFLAAGGAASRGVAAWNGASWSACAAGLFGVVRCFASWDDGSGPELYAGGNFNLFEGQVGLHIARWNGKEWRAISAGPSGITKAIASYDDGTGPHVYAGGAFLDAGGHTLNGIGRWNGSGWDSVGGVATGPGYAAPVVNCLEVLDAGNGPELILAGFFSSVAGVSCAQIARWNGSAFSPVGAGLDDDVVALTVAGSGPAVKLYAAAASLFSFGAGNIATVAKWENGAWTGLPGLPPNVRALAVYDDGTGPSLYAGGQFLLNAQFTANIARWNGSTWVAVGNPTSYDTGVFDLLPYDDGAGQSLLVGGWFQSLGGLPITMLGRWNGTTWSSLGYYEAFDDVAYQLALFDDGTGRGRRLFVAGDDALHVLDGTTWSVVASFGNGHDQALALTAIEPPAAPERQLWVGGLFDHLGGIDAEGIAVLQACDEIGLTFCHGDGSEAPCPCGNESASGSRAGCLNSLGLAGAVRARGRASLSNDSLVLDGSAMTNSSVLYFQSGTRTAPVTFGDGLKCTGNPFVRLGTKTNSAGASSYPVSGDLPVSVRGLVTAPGTRHYQARYRNAATFCTSETFNYTNAVTIVWGA